MVRPPVPPVSASQLVFQNLIGNNGKGKGKGKGKGTGKGSGQGSGNLLPVVDAGKNGKGKGRGKVGEPPSGDDGGDDDDDDRRADDDDAPDEFALPSNHSTEGLGLLRVVVEAVRCLQVGVIENY